MKDRIRITGGTLRGRKIESPPAGTIRPCSDMVRQAVFNMLRDDLSGAVFHDVFAGTGIVGIEALSRGARRVIFVEKDFRQIQLIRRNLERLGLGRDRAATRQSDAHLWATHALFDDAPNIVFLGPPYPLFDEKPDRTRILGLATKVQDRLGPDDLLVYQFPEHVDFADLPDPENWYRQREYGKTKVGIWSRRAGELTDDIAEGSEAGAAEADEQAASPMEPDEAQPDESEARASR